MHWIEQAFFGYIFSTQRETFTYGLKLLVLLRRSPAPEKGCSFPGSYGKDH
jgi:hypothetical protein